MKNEEHTDTDSYLTCRICKKKLKSLGNHIIKRHNISPKDYKKKFKVGFLVCNETRNRHSQASINPHPDYTPMSKENLVKKIKNYEKKNMLSVTLLEEIDPCFIRQVTGCFGSWSKGLSFCKISPKKSTWNEKKVTTEWEKIKPIISTTRKGSLKRERIRKALNSYVKDEKKLERLKDRDIVTIEKVNSAIISIAKKEGFITNKLLKRDSKPCYNFIRKHKILLKDVAKRLGIQHRNSGQIWDNEKVLSKIKEYKKNNIQLNLGNITKIDKGLSHAATKLFGSWDKALIAAGLDPTKERKHLSLPEDFFVKKLKEAEEKHQSLYPTLIEKVLGPHYGIIKYRYGGCKEFCKKHNINFKYLSQGSQN